MSYVFGRWDRRVVEAYVASWIEIRILSNSFKINHVEAYVASWIEMAVAIRSQTGTSCRGLRSLVD